MHAVVAHMHAVVAHMHAVVAHMHDDGIGAALSPLSPLLLSPRSALKSWTGAAPADAVGGGGAIDSALSRWSHRAKPPEAGESCSLAGATPVLNGGAVAGASSAPRVAAVLSHPTGHATGRAAGGGTVEAAPPCWASSHTTGLRSRMNPPPPLHVAPHAPHAPHGSSTLPSTSPAAIHESAPTESLRAERFLEARAALSGQYLLTGARGRFQPPSPTAASPTAPEAYSPASAGPHPPRGPWCEGGAELSLLSHVPNPAPNVSCVSMCANLSANLSAGADSGADVVVVDEQLHAVAHAAAPLQPSPVMLAQSLGDSADSAWGEFQRRRALERTAKHPRALSHPRVLPAAHQRGAM